MTAQAGASFHEAVDWSSIDWTSVFRNVRRLQARIVKAMQQRRWGKVKALQRLLTHSFSAKALAVRRITENTGKRTPGVDGEIWDTPGKKAKAIATLRQRGYNAKPLRRIYIPKGPGKDGKRALSIPSMQDRAMQALYLVALDPMAETTADPNSYGFRRERSTADAIQQCQITLAQRKAPQWILEADIRSCFDRISHEWLLTHTPMDKVILAQWLNAGYLDRNAFHPLESGVPQGGIASPVLANLALDGLERVLRERFPKTTLAGRAACVNFIRYCDDFIVTARSKELLEQEVKPLVEAFLKERGLQLSPEKTRISHIDEGFDFLGQNVRKYNGKLLIKPSKRSIKTLLGKIRHGIQTHKQSTAVDLIAHLNPLIRGWTNYHRHVVSKAVFNKVDHVVFEMLWRWCRRRHRNKSARWIKKKYFKRVGGCDWVFYGSERDAKHAGQERQLMRAASVPIKRHTKIRAAANPYDPRWEVYFEQRLAAKMIDRLRGRKKLRYLWKRQKGRCWLCQASITEETGWHSHHLIPRVQGGKDTVDNLALLHPVCHRQVHSRGLR